MADDTAWEAVAEGSEEWFLRTYPTTIVTPFVPVHITLSMTDLHVTRAGKLFFGLPVEPRASRGFRRHIRKMKARKHG